MNNGVCYDNGNYTVYLNIKDGTKIRKTSEDFFEPSRVESLDIKITNKCRKGCPFCHENSLPNGGVADLDDINTLAESLPPYTEIALGGGDLTEDFNHTFKALEFFTKNKAICSITLRQEDINQMSERFLDQGIKGGYVHGIGISVSDIDDERLWTILKKYPNAVLHIIAGVATPHMIEILKQHKCKVLILGYKNFRRGRNYYKNEFKKVKRYTKYLRDSLPFLLENLEVCSFDNLALEQLKVKELISEREGDTKFMGEDGTATFYIDLVNMEYAKSSTSTVRYVIEDLDVANMFNQITNIIEGENYEF